MEGSWIHTKNPVISPCFSKVLNHNKTEKTLGNFRTTTHDKTVGSAGLDLARCSPGVSQGSPGGRSSLPGDLAG
jgi:hypothetical protein